MDLTKPGDEHLHHVGSAHGVGKSCVFGPGKSEARQAQLTDATQALNLRRVEEPHRDGFLFVLECDQAVDGVAQQHARTLARRRMEGERSRMRATDAGRRAAGN